MTSRLLLPATLIAIALGGTVSLMAGAQTVAPDADMLPASCERHGDRDGPREGQRGGPRGGGALRALFAEVDTDADGSVTQAEIDSFRATTIGGADVSGDGALSLSEFDTIYRQFTRERMVATFQRLDADGDGQIAPAEIDSRLDRIVARMDRDGDGTLTLRARGQRD